MTRLSEEKKAAIYADIHVGENIRQLCARHNIRANIIYDWLKKKNTNSRKSPFEPAELIGHGQSG